MSRWFEIRRRNDIYRAVTGRDDRRQVSRPVDSDGECGCSSRHECDCDCDE